MRYDPKNIDSIAWSLAALIAGGGIIAAVLYLTVIPISDLLLYALMVLLPLAAIAVGLGLVSAGTFQTLRTLVSSRGSFGDRVKHWVDRLEREPQATPDPWPAN